MKILVVEDEVSLRRSLEKGLRKYGYAVDCAADGEEASLLFAVNFYDAVILDLNLPKIDGADVLKEIRKVNKEVKILILSARAELENKIEGLDAGANDFLAKPFHFAELEARIRALIRRRFIQRDAVLNAGGLSVNTIGKFAAAQNEKIALTKKEYGILEYLLLNRGRVIGAAELIEHVWDDGEDADRFFNSFKVCLNGLKKKIYGKTRNGDLIKNTRGVGYYIPEETL